MTTNKSFQFGSSPSQQEIQSRIESDIKQKVPKQLPKLLSCFISKNGSPRFKTPNKKRIQTQVTGIFDKQPQQQRQQSPLRSKRNIEFDIHQSFSFINAIKLKKYKLVDGNTRFLTEPEFQKPKDRLFSYLERDVITKKNYQVSQNDVRKFYNSALSKPIQQKVRINSRDFLKDAAFNNYHNFEKAKQKFLEDSKVLIRDQMKIRKKKYASDYRVRKNCPYFSFLTLNKQEKTAVLKKLDRRSSLKDNLCQIHLK